MKLHELDQLIGAVCPIDGINSAGVIFYRPDATAQQRSAADALMEMHLPTLSNSGPPDNVTMRQARLALLQIGRLADVNAAVAAADDATKITWDYSSEVHRDHPFVAAMAGALWLTAQQLDDLFTLAATL